MSSPAYIEVYHISYTLPQGQQYITIMYAENTHTIGVLYIHQQIENTCWSFGEGNLQKNILNIT